MMRFGSARLPLFFLAPLAFTTVLCAASSATAFTGTVHNAMTRTACKNAGLPSDFCRRAGMEAENTDAHEWKDMRAHAQMSGSVPMCDAANGIVGRLRDLGDEYRENLAALSSTTSYTKQEEYAGVAAAAVGRSLHTLQDNFAHQGVTNQEHGWYSLGDFCEGTKTSPDFRPGAEDEARVMTEDFFAELAVSLQDASLRKLLDSNACPWDQDSNESDPCSQVVLPAPWELCNFLAESKTWDGVDRRWDSNIVSSALVDAFFTGATLDLCSEANLELAPADPVDVSGGIPTCTAAHLVCFGKVDDPGVAADEPAASPPATEESGGCATTQGTKRGDFVLAAALIALYVARRKRRRG